MSFTFITNGSVETMEMESSNTTYEFIYERPHNLPSNPHETMALMLEENQSLRCTIDVTSTKEMMKHGQPFIRYVPSNSSDEQPRKEYIDLFYSHEKGVDRLCWSEPGNHVVRANHYIDLSAITDIYLGVQTGQFWKDAQDERCFSILTQDQMLNVEAESVEMVSSWLFGINMIIMEVGREVSVGKGNEPGQLMSPLSSKTASATKPKRKSTEIGEKRQTRKWSVQPVPHHLMTAAQRQREQEARESQNVGRKRSLSVDRSTPPRRSTGARAAEIRQLTDTLEHKTAEAALWKKMADEHSITINKMREECESRDSIIVDLRSSNQRLRRDQAMQATNMKRALSSSLNGLKNSYSLLQSDVRTQLSNMSDVLTSTFLTMMQRSRKHANEIAKLKDDMADERQKTRNLHNKLIELQGNIRVYCRVRPQSEQEKRDGDASCVEFPEDDSLVLHTSNGPKTFDFDRVYDSTCSQSDVFQDCAPFVQSCVDGYNICIFAYGQTGAGKSYTMEGPAHDRGVNYRAMEEIFRLTKQGHDGAANRYNYSVAVSVLEIYNEQLRDLLAPPKSQQKLEIRQGPEGVYVPDLIETPVTCVADVHNLLQTQAYPNRRVTGTEMNEHSSRSHCLLFVKVTGHNPDTDARTYGKLILIDLAGSERIKRSKAEGEALKEAQCINQSLSALGIVISAIQAKQAHIPYRNSKLTYLLQDCLGGNSKCLMFCQVSPVTSSAGESLCSLQFAARARATELGKAQKNASNNKDLLTTKQQLKALTSESTLTKDQVKKLTQSLREAQEATAERNDVITTLQSQIKIMREELHTLREWKQSQASIMNSKDKEIREMKKRMEDALRVRPMTHHVTTTSTSMSLAKKRQRAQSMMVKADTHHEPVTVVQPHRHSTLEVPVVTPIVMEPVIAPISDPIVPVEDVIVPTPTSAPAPTTDIEAPVAMEITPTPSTSPTPVNEPSQLIPSSSTSTLTSPNKKRKEVTSTSISSYDGEKQPRVEERRPFGIHNTSVANRGTVGSGISKKVVKPVVPTKPATAPTTTTTTRRVPTSPAPTRTRSGVSSPSPVKSAMTSASPMKSPMKVPFSSDVSHENIPPSTAHASPSLLPKTQPRVRLPMPDLNMADVTPDDGMSRAEAARKRIEERRAKALANGTATSSITAPTASSAASALLNKKRMTIPSATTGPVGKWK